MKMTNGDDSGGGAQLAIILSIVGRLHEFWNIWTITALVFNDDNKLIMII